MTLIGPEQSKQLRAAGRVSAVGIELVVAILIGYYAGRWADQKFDTTPYLTNTGFFLGVIAGFRGLFMVARRARQEQQSKD